MKELITNPHKLIDSYTLYKGLLEQWRLNNLSFNENKSFFGVSAYVDLQIKKASTPKERDEFIQKYGDVAKVFEANGIRNNGLFSAALNYALEMHKDQIIEQIIDYVHDQYEEDLETYHADVEEALEAIHTLKENE